MAAPAQAAQTGAEPNIIVTASRTEAEPADTTVIEAEEIQRLQPATVLESLDRAAGVRAFSKGGLSYLSIRGGEPNFTLVLIEGVRVNDPTNSRGGAFDFEQIDPYAIERIEIARSALSAVHGADALSGVVHVRLRTPRPGESGLSAGGFVDSEGAATLNATGVHGWSNGGLLAGAGWFDSGDLFEGVDLDRRQAFGRVTQRLGGIDASALALHGRARRLAFAEDSGGPLFAAVRERERRDTRLTLAGLELVRDDDRVRPRLALSWSRLDSDTDTPPIASGALPGVPRIVAGTRFDRLEAVADVRARASDRLTLAAGAGYIRERGDSDGFIDIGFPLPADFAIERSVRSLFGEATFVVAPVSVTAGLRYDDASRHGALTARAGARIELRPGLAAFADYSEGYKLPSLFALAYPLIANPELEPERGRSAVVGLEHRSGGRSLRLALFLNRFRNLIDFDVERFTNINRARVRTRGAQLEATVPIGTHLRLEGALTYMEVDNDPGAPPLRSRPQWQGAFAVAWRALPRLSLAAAGRFNGAYFDSSVPTGLIRQDGRLEIDATAEYELSADLALRITARNLTSADYEDSVGFPAPGRLIRAGVRAAY